MASGVQSLEFSAQEISLLPISRTAFKTADGRVCPSRVFKWDGHAILDTCAVEASYGHLLVLTADGALHGIDLNSAESRHLCTTNLPSMAVEEDGSHFGKPSYRLHSSADGKYAAIVVDRGQSGIVVETQGGRPTMPLHGGDYCEESVPFSACFLRFGRSDVFVHRTAWNRLDVADPATGTSLTKRYIAPYGVSGQRPSHYLDYFHGQASAQPRRGLDLRRWVGVASNLNPQNLVGHQVVGDKSVGERGW